MAQQTRSGYRLIDDSEVDADSPITQSLMTALRDQWVGLSASAGSLPDSERVRCPEKIQCATGNAGKILVANSGGGFDLSSPSSAGFSGAMNAVASTSGSSVAWSIFSRIGDFTSASRMCLVFYFTCDHPNVAASGTIQVLYNTTVSHAYTWNCQRTASNVDPFAGSGTGSTASFSVSAQYAGGAVPQYCTVAGTVGTNNITGTVSWTNAANIANTMSMHGFLI